MNVTCSHCGARIESDAKACGYCGMPIKRTAGPLPAPRAIHGPVDKVKWGERIECAKCGTESAASAGYCNHCGAALGPTSMPTKVTRSPQASPVPAEAPVTRSGVGLRGSRFGCGIGAGLIVAIFGLVGQTLSSGRVSDDAVLGFAFNLGLFGCIATAAEYAWAGQWKKAGYAVLTLIGFLVFWFAGWWGLPLLFGK